MRLDRVQKTAAFQLPATEYPAAASYKSETFGKARGGRIAGYVSDEQRPLNVPVTPEMQSYFRADPKVN